MNTYTLTVPCKTYIKKYFTAIYGDPICLDIKTDFGDTILTKISGRPLTRLNRQMIGIAFRDFDHILKFQLPIDFFYRIDNNLCEQRSYSINRYLENIFDADMFNLIRIASYFGVEKKKAMETFLAKYDILIDEDLSYDALKKKDSRMLRKSTHQNHFLVSLATASPMLSLRS